MSIFNRDKLAAPPPEGADGSLDLPTDYFDETSPYFVPAYLRETWKQCAGLADTISHLHGAIRAIAEHRALKTLRPELFEKRPPTVQWVADLDGGGFSQVTNHPDSYAPHLLGQAAEMAIAGSSLLEVQSKEGQREVGLVMQGDWNSIAAEALHALRLHHVAAEHANREKSTTRSRAIERRNRCPVCNSSDHGTGEPTSREIVPAGKSQYSKAIKFTSCGLCYLVAVAKFTEAAADQNMGEWPTKTRRELVTALLESKGN
jgi:hypothetical protein